MYKTIALWTILIVVVATFVISFVVFMENTTWPQSQHQSQISVSKSGFPISCNPEVDTLFIVDTIGLMLYFHSSGIPCDSFPDSTMVISIPKGTM